jgi:ribosomal protein L37AE/L43A
MGVNVYHERNRPMTTTEGLKGDKLCNSCFNRFKIVERGQDGKWYCPECLGFDALIYEVDSDASDD